MLSRANSSLSQPILVGNRPVNPLRRQELKHQLHSTLSYWPVSYDKLTGKFWSRGAGLDLISSDITLGRQQESLRYFLDLRVMPYGSNL